MAHGGPVDAVRFSSRGDALVTASRDGMVRLWDIPAEPPGQTSLRFLGSHPRFSPDASRLVAFDYSSGPLLIELPSGRAVPDAFLGWDPTGQKRDSNSEVFDATGARLATALRESDEAVVWDAATGKRVAGALRNDHPSGKSYGGRREISALGLSPGGGRLVTYGLELGLASWDVGSGRLLASAVVDAFAYSITFSPDGRRFALSLSDRTDIRDAGAIDKPAAISRSGPS